MFVIQKIRGYPGHDSPGIPDLGDLYLWGGGRERFQISDILGTFVSVEVDATDIRGDSDTKRLGSPDIKLQFQNLKFSQTRL
jgi:hypothetical protein